MTRWVCLDVGEVLIDETRVWSTWADVLGVPRFTFMALLGAAIADGGEHPAVFERLGIAGWADHAPEVNRRYGGFTAADLYPDALPTIAAVRAAGLAVAVIGNQPARRHDELRAVGVEPDVMVMSETLGVEKPEPEFFGGALAAMGGPAPADVVYVGDRIDNDVRPAAAAGLHTAWLRRGPWGLLQSPGAAAPSLVLDRLDELPGRLAQLWS